jgi:hypothetical protein
MRDRRTKQQLLAEIKEMMSKLAPLEQENFDLKCYQRAVLAAITGKGLEPDPGVSSALEASFNAGWKDCSMEFLDRFGHTDASCGCTKHIPKNKPEVTDVEA